MRFGDMSRQGWSYISEVVVESVEVGLTQFDS